MDEPRRLAGKTLGTRALANRYDPEGGDRWQERIEPSTFNNHIMAGESDPNLLTVALSVNKLMPKQNYRLLSQQDLQRRWWIG